jgi:hypothetical protein
MTRAPHLRVILVCAVLFAVPTIALVHEVTAYPLGNVHDSTDRPPDVTARPVEASGSRQM